MDKQGKNLQKRGRVIEALPSANFLVKLEDGNDVLCHLSGKIRIHKIKILPGDFVTIETSPYDEKRGRIIFRGK